MTTDTPRTDAFIDQNSLLAFSEDKYELTIVQARQLERELNEAKAEVERLRENQRSDQFRDATKMVPIAEKNDHIVEVNKMVPTPRTDAFETGDGLLESWEQEWEAAISFARQLERELATSQAEVERLKANLRRAIEIAEEVNDRWCYQDELFKLKATLNQDNK